MPPAASTRSRTWLLLALLVATSLVALAPWWRNRGYLRDFYDYGLVMAGVARIGGGERPYVDFVTPIQSGTFWFNALSEKLGGTYQAMTLGGAAVILLSLPTLAWLLARRLPWWTAIPVAGAVVVGSASQHTIVWHNSMGVVCLAVVVWAGAVAPVLRREHWREHTLLALALCLGGVNKLNFHLVALAAAAAWTLRAVLLTRSSWGRGLGTLALLALAGVALPIGAELLWTGASFDQWEYNVVALAAANRAGYLHSLANAKFYLEPQHSYYGPLLVPQVGLTVVALVSLAGLVSLVRARGIDRWLAVAATAFALAAALGLLATNHEIAYLALAAAVVLAVALPLGFGPDRPPRPLLAALLVPILFCGGTAWLSAWQGQRSQFGHATAPRSAYRDPSLVAPELGYLRGTRLPPELCDSLEGLVPTLPPANAHGLRPVFYGPGLEWFEHICPALKTPGLPLWLHDGTSYGPNEHRLLASSLAAGDRFQEVLVPIAWDQWPHHCRLAMEVEFAPSLRGPTIRAYRTRTSSVQSSTPLELLNLFGGNLHPAHLDFAPRIRPFLSADGRAFLGQTSGTAAFRLNAPSNRIVGTVLLQRRPGAPAGALSAEFTVRYTRGDSPGEAWHQNVVLPAGCAETTADYQIDGRQQALDFVVRLPAAPDLAAGWLGPRIQHSQPSAEPPASLYPTALAGRHLSADEVRPACPSLWQPDAVLLRGGTVAADHFELPPGGELWLRADRPLAELLGHVRIADDQPTNPVPFVRLVWAKAGRLEMIAQTRVRTDDRRIELRAWSPEPEGWFGILIDPTPGTPPALVYLDSAHFSE